MTTTPRCATCGQPPHENRPWPTTGDAAAQQLAVRSPGTCTSYYEARACCLSRKEGSDYHRQDCPVLARNIQKSNAKHAATLAVLCRSSACKKYSVKSGEPCRFDDGRIRLTPHNQRRLDAQKVA